MKIGVNTRFLLKGQLEGIGMYTQEVFRRVVQLLPEHEFYFFFDRPYDASYIRAGNITPVVVHPPARHPFLWYWWFEYALPAALKKHGIQLLLSPDGYGSLSTEVPQIITIHDLGFEHFPEHNPPLVRWYYRHFVPKYCHKASHLLTVSDFTKHDIIRRYGVAPEKITVAPNGFDTSELPENMQTIAENYDLSDAPYFAYLGAIHPRKNILTLLKAFEHFKKETGLPHRLVLIGRDAWMNDALEDFYSKMSFRTSVIRVPKSERTEALRLLREACALVYPSWFEGFGIPILEAMSLGVPVICSNTSSMPEVAGDAALLVAPDDLQGWSDAMQRLATDNVLRDTLTEKGRKQASAYSWEESAQKITAIIRQQLADNDRKYFSTT